MSYPWQNTMKAQPKPQPTKTGSVQIPETTLSHEAVLDFLITAKVKMLMAAPFFGQLACRMRFIDATEWCPTAATDGRNFYYNRNFVAALHARHEQQLVFLIGHEVLHCVYDHMSRRGHRIPELYNVACDFCVNNDLIEARVGAMIDLVEICYDRKYQGMTSEQIYDILYQEMDSQGRIKQVALDMHLDPQSQDGQPQDGDDQPGEGNNDGSQGPIRYSESERQEISSQVRDHVEAAARATGAGNLPSGVRRLVEQLLNPQLDWREMLAVTIQSLIKNDYSSRRFSRKGLDQHIYIPGMDNENTIDIAIAIDTSGSISESMLTDFLSEIRGIMEQYTTFKIHLFCFDTDVHNPQPFTESNLGDLINYEIQGGGGTEFTVCYDYMKQNDILPQQFVMFTDGYPWGSWGDEFYTETLFIVHGGRGGEHPTAPFGTTVPYTSES